MVEVELFAGQRPRAILAGILVALENVVARQLQLLARQLVEEGEQNHARQPDGPAWRAYRVEFRHWGVVRGKIDPVQQGESPKVIIVMMHDLRVASRQQAKRAAGADHIHRLPEAIQDQHRLVKRSFHTER